MLRTFISGLFLVLGVVCAVYGGSRIYQQDDARPETAQTVEPEPVPIVQAERSVASEQDRADSQIAREQQVESFARAPEPVFDAPVFDEPVFDAASSRVSPPSQEATSFQDRLYQVPVAYEAPETAGLGAPFDVTFAVDGTGDDSAADALPGQDAKQVEALAKISDRLKASLVGSAFEIELLSPDVQRLSLLTENVWRWRVTPQREGEHKLVLELFALDGDEAVPVRTFNDTVTVNVSAFRRVLGVADTANPLFVLLGGIGSAIGGLFGFLRFFGKRG